MTEPVDVQAERLRELAATPAWTEAAQGVERVIGRLGVVPYPGAGADITALRSALSALSKEYTEACQDFAREFHARKSAVRQRDNLRDALKRIADSYPSQPYEDGETITEWRPAPTDTGIPTNRRIAREALRAAAVGEGEPPRDLVREAWLERLGEPVGEDTE